MQERKRIAIYGGTFDPVHNGHLEVARKVSQLFAIDEFLFVPARVAPHKLASGVSSALHRYAMLALATRAEPQLSISTCELDGPERQYTVDTLFQFRARFGESAELFFVMGADSWVEITSWREWQRLMKLANLIVVTRPGYEVSTEHVGAEIAARVVAVPGSSPNGSSETGVRIYLTDAVMHDVSATQVRAAARENRLGDLERFVPLEVADYIRKYKLYRNTNEA
jgi:nicotinate-nucleotide adenylyltransferase